MPSSVSVDLSDLFPSGDFEFRLGLRAREPGEFFRAVPARGCVLAERRRWVEENPAAYLALLPRGEPLLEEAEALIASPLLLAEPLARLGALGTQQEADLVLLALGGSGEMELVGGCVCFPSAWRLADKIGRPMTFVHAPVPGLEQRLGRQIGTALSKLRPGTAWLRNNWSLTASAELNQHPDRGLPRLTAEPRLEEVWLRVERQALMSLPESGGVLFAIRIEMETLRALKNEAPESMRALAQALRTMPDGVAAYKGLAEARAKLIAQLAT